MLDNASRHLFLIWGCSQGGIVGKERQFRQKGKPFLLTVEDPQQPGTDIGSGAFNISQVGSPTSDQSCIRSEAPALGSQGVSLNES